MRLSILLCLVLLGGVLGSRKLFHGRRLGGNVPPPPPRFSTRAVIQDFFNQTLDHSDPSNLMRWQQKYYVNEQYFDATKRNVAFLMIGGEGAASSGWMTTGTWTQNAKKFNALMFQLEHRFYGVSQPFEDTSLEHLKYLSSEQALDDCAEFIEAMNEKYQLAKDVKWVAFGGSYSGSLAAWLRLKYPHLVFAASSSSGPLEAIVDFQEYLTVVANDMRVLHSPKCADVVQEGYRQLEASLENDTETVEKLFNLCTPLKDSLSNSNDIGNFMEIIADSFAYVAQYNKDSNAYTVQSVCDLLVDESQGSEIERLAAVTQLVNGKECISYTFESLMETMNDITLDGYATSSGMRQWMYQTCTEFAFYQTSSIMPPVFGTKFPIEFFVDYCAGSYNSAIDLNFLERVTQRTNTIYGAKDIEVSRVVFIHGSVDPWHPLGVIQSDNEDAPAIYINGTSHCADMYEPNVNDPVDLIEATKKVTEILGKWLAD